MDSQEALLAFIQALLGAVKDVDKADVPWLLRQLDSAELPARLKTVQSTAVARRLGSEILMHPAQFCLELRVTLAIYFEMEEHLPTWLLIPCDRMRVH